MAERSRLPELDGALLPLPLSVLVQMLVLLLLLSLLSFLTVFDDSEDMVFEYLSIAVTSEL